MLVQRVCRLAVILAVSFSSSSASFAGQSAQQTVSPIRAVSAAAAAPRGVVRVSVASDGTQGNFASAIASLSSDGRYVVFESDATNLVAGDTNNRRDVFVHDRSTGVTTRESISSSRAEANASCTFAQISADGRFVAFLSSATNLVSGVSGQQIYVRDRQLGLTTVASVSSDGSPANPSSITSYAMTPDGRFVSFATSSTNLVPGAPSSFTAEIYTRDRATGVTTRDSVSAAGAAANGSSSGPSISDDGRYVSFYSSATNLVSGLPSSITSGIFVYDRSTGQTSLASVGPAGETLAADSTNSSLSGDGRFIAFVARNGSVLGLYFRDRQTAQTSLVLQSGVEPEVSSDGRFVTYVRSGNVEVWDRTTGQATAIAPGARATAVGGAAVAFDTTLTLVGGDTNGVHDVFLAPVGSDPGAPNPPTNLAYSLAGPTLTLTWAAPSAGNPVTDYLLEAGLFTLSTDVANFSTGTTETRFSTPFSSRATFYVRVRAANAAGVSVPSNEIVLAPFTLPGAPDGLTASVVGNAVTLTWSPASGNLVSYIVEAGAASGGTELATFNTGTTSTTFTAASVANGTYFVRIRAVSLGGAGSASNEVSFTVAGGCAPGAPSGLTRSVAGSSVTLSWTAGADATSYILEAGSGTGRSDIAVIDLNSSATTFSTTGVPAGTYFLRLRSKNSCGQSAVSNEAVAIVSAPR